MPNSHMPRFSLRIVKADGGPESHVSIEGDSLLCGRAAELVLSDDPFLADTQARFFISSSGLAVTDVGGGCGVFLRLRAECPLSPGDELRVGRQLLVIEELKPPEPGPDGAVAWGSPDPGYRIRVLAILEGGVLQTAYPLRDGTHLVGRDNGAITFPKDGFVSGRHAMLSVSRDRLSVSDLGSSNGTFVRLTGPALLQPGDQLLMGKQLIRVEAPGSH